MKILNRLYSDYFMPSRLAEYERIIVTAKEQNYVHLTIPEFYDKRESGIDAEKKYFIHRHDIDTDPLTARRMFEIEKKYGVRTSYYFRLSTLDVPLMREIHEFGSEVGYHYEELAQFCKDKRIRSPEKARGNFEQVREIFRANFRAISERAGFPVTTIASHGDFVNRKLGITNSAFITRELMDELGIRFECYDAELLEKFGTIISDRAYPEFYRPREPFACMQEGHKVIYLLTHPRHWRVSVSINSRDNFLRLWEGLKYAV